MGQENRNSFTNPERTSERRCGVYEIVCAPTHERYVGASRSMHHRCRKHRRQLLSGRHYTRRLQEAFDKFGIENFYVLEKEVPLAQLMAEEAKVIDKWRKKNLCFNEQGGSDWRERVSARVKRQHAEGKFGYDPATAKKRIPWDRSRPHGLKGRKQTPEHLAALAASRRKKRGPDLL